MKKYITKENFIKLFMIFVIIQPLIDIYILFKASVVDFFGFSPATIIRMFFIGVLVLMAIFTIKLTKKHLWFVFYGFLVIGYVILHHLNATHFISVDPNNFNYSFVSEIFYIIRMLMPLSVIAMSYYIEFKDDKLNSIIKWLVIIISGSIVFTNLICISLGSYSKVPIKSNIFSWFIDNYDTYNYLELASKGFFNDPNRLAALLVSITPILFYVFIKKSNIFNGLLIGLQLLGMYMLGTKVSTLGFLGIAFASFFIYLYFWLIKKELKFCWRVNNTLFIVLIASCILLPYSPAVNRTKVDNTRNEDYVSGKDGKKDKEKEKTNEMDDQLISVFKEVEGSHDFDESFNYKDAKAGGMYILDHRTLVINKKDTYDILLKFISNNYNDFSINPQFILLSYPYQNDPFFWYDIMKKPLNIRANFRSTEKAMLERVKSINNNANDELYGITFTRMQNIFDLERDFISHYYTLGIVGLILFLVPYLIITFICGLRMAIKYKENFNIRNVMFTLGILIALFAAFYSGNVMDGLVVTLILGFIIGQLLRNIFPPKES